MILHFRLPIGNPKPVMNILDVVFSDSVSADPAKGVLLADFRRRISVKERDSNTSLPFEGDCGSGHAACDPGSYHDYVAFVPQPEHTGCKKAIALLNLL
jgi:hypothetical protein